MEAKWPKTPIWSPWSPQHRPPMLHHPQTALRHQQQQSFSQLLFPLPLQAKPHQPLALEQEQQQLLEDLDQLDQEREELQIMNNRRHSITTVSSNLINSSNWKTPPPIRQASGEKALQQIPSMMEITPITKKQSDDENFIFPSVKNQIRAKLHDSIKRSIDSCSIKSDPF